MRITKVCPIARRPRTAVYWPMLLMVPQLNHCWGFHRLNRANTKMQPMMIPRSGRLTNLRMRSPTVAEVSLNPRGRGNITARVASSDCLPGDLLLVGVLPNGRLHKFYPLSHIALVDDNRSGNDVIQRGHSHLLVEIEDLHREITLEPQTLAVRREDFSFFDAFKGVWAVVH